MAPWPSWASCAGHCASGNDEFYHCTPQVIECTGGLSYHLKSKIKSEEERRCWDVNMYAVAFLLTAESLMPSLGSPSAGVHDWISRVYRGTRRPIVAVVLQLPGHARCRSALRSGKGHSEPNWPMGALYRRHLPQHRALLPFRLPARRI
jgi:hypothetical protein